MKTKSRPLPTVKSYRPTTFAAHTAQAIAEGEAREDQHFSGTGHGPDAEAPHSQGRLRHAPGFPLASCIAYTPQGNVCGATPAPFLDLVRGGMVCAAHKPERGLS
jgi:hypothetical protein